MPVDRSIEMDDRQIDENQAFQPEASFDLPPLLLEYWQIALRWKWLIAAIVSASMAAGLILSLLMTSQYSASARLEVSREQKNVTNVQGVENAEAGRNQEFYNTQWALLEARSLAERVAREMRLASNDAFFAAHGETPEGDDGAESGSAARREREKQAVDLLLKHVSISPVRGSSLVDVGYTSASPELSAKVANTWTQQFIVSNMQRRFSSTSDARRFLEGRLEELRGRLEKSERDAVNFAANKGIVQVSRNAEAGGGKSDLTLAGMDLSLLNVELAKATAQRVAAESRLNVVNRSATAESRGRPGPGASTAGGAAKGRQYWKNDDHV